MTGEVAVDTKQVAVQSPAEKWLVRTVFGICAVLAANKLNSIDTTVDEVKKTQNAQAVKLAEVNGKVDGINTRIDSALLYQVDDLKKRVERLEAASKVP